MPKSRRVWLGLLLGASVVGACSEDSSQTTTGGGGAGSAALGGSAGDTSAVGGSTAGMVGDTAGAAGSGGSSTGAAGEVNNGGSSGENAAGAGGEGGGVAEPKMCETAEGPVPTFTRVPASDEAIPGAVGVIGNPEEPDVLYVPEHFTGDVRIIKDGELQNDPLLHVDVRQDPPGREQGLLSIVLSPDFTTDHLMYVHYSAVNPVGQTTVEEWELTDSMNATRVRSVYVQNHSHQWHNGGNLQFGSDGWLYISIGDNQDDCGPSCAQEDEGLYGRIRKVDVSSNDPNSTAVTFENGLRNPWRWSFDPLTFDVVIGDVGDGGGASEKLFYAPSANADGKNWDWAPGTRDNRSPQGTIATLANDGGAIIGGVVYRGTNPNMAGACGLIFYGHLKGQVYTIKSDGSGNQMQGPLSGINDLGSFGVDANGEIYMTYLGGQIFRIDAE